MNHHHIPLATATALVAIARPAMAASGLAPLLPLMGKTGLLMAILGCNLIALKWLSLFLQRSLLDEEERMQLLAFSKITLTGKLLIIGGIAVMLIRIMGELS